MKKIRVLQINKLYYPWIGGIESAAKAAAEGLAEETDMTVLVCVPKGTGKKEEIGSVRVIRAGSLGMKFSMPISLSFPFLVRKYAVQADIVILHDPFPLGDLAMLLSGFKGKLFLWWHSDIIRQKMLAKLIGPIIKGILKRADVIFTSSERFIDGSAYLGDFRSKCRVVPYGIETAKYLSAKRTAILTERLTDKKNKKLLFAGRLVYYKGAGVMLDAFGKIAGAELFIVGTGADEQILRRQAELYGGRVHFMGRLSDEDMRCAFGDCDIFLFPSTQKSEAFGIVQLEAMVYGKPVINTSLNTSVPFVSIDGETGITVTPGSSEELAAAANRLICDDGLRKRMGHNARERVLGHFDIKNMTDTIKRICEETVKE